jgi:hypothetical protein
MFRRNICLRVQGPRIRHARSEEAQATNSAGSGWDVSGNALLIHVTGTETHFMRVFRAVSLIENTVRYCHVNG